MANNPLDDLIEGIGQGEVEYTPRDRGVGPDIQTVESVRNGSIPDQLVDDPLDYTGRVEVPVEHDGHAGKIVADRGTIYYAGAARVQGDE